MLLVALHQVVVLVVVVGSTSTSPSTIAIAIDYARVQAKKSLNC